MENNKILKKIVIAMNLRHEDVREVFHLGGLELSISQTGAFLVSPSNKNFQSLSLEKLESFLNGMIIYSRGPKNAPNIIPMALANLVYWLGENGQIDALEALNELLSDVVSQVRKQL